MTMLCYAFLLAKYLMLIETQTHICVFKAYENPKAKISTLAHQILHNKNYSKPFKYKVLV